MAAMSECETPVLFPAEVNSADMPKTKLSIFTKAARSISALPEPSPAWVSSASTRAMSPISRRMDRSHPSIARQVRKHHFGHGDDTILFILGHPESAIKASHRMMIL
jgi:hypothetical protein